MADTLEELRGLIRENLDRNDFVTIEKLAKVGRSFTEVLAKGKGKLSLTCDDCGRTFQRKSALREHLRYKHNATCKQCGKTFKNKKGLGAHLRKDRNVHKE